MHTSPSSAATTAAPPRGRAARAALYVLLALLTLALAVTGGAKVIGADFMAANMAEIHFGTAPTIVIGALELLAAAGLWTRRYRTLSLAVFLLILAGGVGAHWGYGHPAERIAPPFAIAALTFAAMWLDRGRALWDFVLRRA